VDSLASHDDVEGLWYFTDDDGGAAVERHAAANMKRTWLGGARDWTDADQSTGEEFLRHATEIKNIWVPYGE
jgi:aldehyde dehydrogenase (NAD+)